ncbi:MAG: tRNA 2-selenouridine(34) synthase MnmH, partial [Deltaproteobacteria bacterium]|nr:tRNA 2-selenouridine(34) synthase MnmH [Deltaproteobacteria bacterium]
MKPNPDSIATLLARATAVVDVRSPGEFAKGAIAGAVNIPLFSNQERAEIGTLYKALGKDTAVEKGLGLMGGKLGDFVSSFTPYKSGRLLIYCARGGMRSASVVGLLGGLGFDVTQLPGGYKAFRAYLLERLESHLPPRLIVLHGQTGVGKTLLLRRLKNFLDLEDMAQHRSSVFGAMNLTPRTQQQFEAHLLAALGSLDYSRPVWVEGESRKIGSALMPESLRRQMQTSPCVLVTASPGVRVARTVAEYGREDQSTRDQAEAALRSITRLLGTERTESLIARVRAGDFESVAAELLEQYYDARYAHSMRDYT